MKMHSEDAAMVKDNLELIGIGLNFEDLPVGRKWKTLSRTIMDADICTFINVIHMTASLFTDMDHSMDDSINNSGRLVPGALAYCYAEGLLSQSTMQHTGVAFLSMELKMENPVFAGDTIHVECEVIESRLSNSRPGRGLIRTRNKVVKHDGTVALTYRPLRMVKCRNLLQ